MTFKIEKGIPLCNNSGPKAAPVRFPFCDMAIGDSFFVPCEDHMESYVKEATKVRNDAQKYGRESKNLAFRITIRRQDGGFRVWREV